MKECGSRLWHQGPSGFDSSIRCPGGGRRRLGRKLGDQCKCTDRNNKDQFIKTNHKKFNSDDKTPAG